MHIILDFDGTITADDTIDSLAAFAIAFQEARQKQAQSGDSSVDWDARWKAIVDDYMADHRHHKASYAPAEHARTTLGHELDYLRSLRDVDRRSIRALRDAGLFAGLSPLPDRLVEAGRRAVAVVAEGSSSKDSESDLVRLRSGFSEFLDETAARRKWPVSIVSINWSDAWIRGVIRSRQSIQSEQDVDICIFANKVTESGAIIPNFPREGASRESEDDEENDPVASCSDKLEAMEAAARAAASFREDVQDHDPEPVVYLGDSTTDLECLVHSGRNGGGGIVLADGDGPMTSSLLKTLARLGYSVPHVSEADSFQSRRSDEKDSSPRLAWARDFDEILSSKILD